MTARVYDDSDAMTAALDARSRRRAERRGFFRSALGAVAVTAAGASALTLAGEAQAQTAATYSDQDILNFALNLEYLEAQFYSYAVNGGGLAASLLTGTGTQGAVTVTGGAAVDFSSDPVVGRYAREIAADEAAHVAFLRTSLGTTTAVAQPAIDLSVGPNSAFSKAAVAAKLINAGDTFNPFGSIENFLLAAFLFEDVGVTAYKGASPLLSKTYIEAAAGILSVEAYHAATIRGELYRRGSVAGSTLIASATAISTARDSLDGGSTLDQGITPTTTTKPNQTTDTTALAVSNIVPADTNAITFSRSPSQVLNIVYLNAAASSGGGFFPNGLNGTIKAATAST